jgi:hypothetical protein
MKQREYDGKWMLMAKVPDTDNRYSYKSENGQVYHIVPTMWIIIGVYDYLLEINP